MSSGQERKEQLLVVCRTDNQTIPADAGRETPFLFLP